MIIVPMRHDPGLHQGDEAACREDVAVSPLAVAMDAAARGERPINPIGIASRPPPRIQAT